MNYYINITQNQLISYNIHLTPKQNSWDPHSALHLTGIYKKNYIINTTHTTLLIQRAFLFLTKIYRLYGFAIFVHQYLHYPLPLHVIKKNSYFYLNTKWRPGLLSNFKELARTGAHKAQLLNSFIHTNQLPKAVFLTSPAHDYWLVNEARRTGTPTIMLIGPEFNVNLATFPIPCNNQNPKFLAKITKLFNSSIVAGICERSNDLSVFSI